MCRHNCTIANVKSILALAIVGAAWAQPLTVYSDLAEIDSNGKVTAPESPREILSPAVVRNGFTSFQVVVEAPADKKWWLFVGQNPENSFKVTIYKESGNALDPVELPRQSSGTEVLWIDVWTDANAPIRRVKLEPEVNLEDDWVIYPIEARVMDAKVPDGSQPATALCGLPKPDASNQIAALRYRNALQDAALSTLAHADELKKVSVSCDTSSAENPEQYLRIRDYLLRLR